jgi:hypothetical protein
MLDVAILSENETTDGVIYQRLLERVLGQPVRFWWPPGFHMTGWPKLYQYTPWLLQQAEAAGVRHAVIAVDNDGGERRHPEHAETDTPFPVGTSLKALSDSEGCRTCSLTACVPPSWNGAGGQTCIAIPVQALETWLLWLRQYAFKRDPPEKNFHRSFLKKEFYGGDPPAPVKVQLAVAELSRPDALDRLRERPSFTRFEAGVRTWGA